MSIGGQLKSISFKILGEDEISKLSISNVDKIDQHEDLKKILSTKVGAQKPSISCSVCGLKGGVCLGHEKSINLACPVLNPGTRNYFKLFLRDYCFDCKRYELNSKKRCTYCKKVKPSLRFDNPYTIYLKKEQIRVDKLYQDLSNLDPQETKPFFNDTEIGPKSFFITKLIIPSINIRPNINYNGKQFEDDLTKKLETILQVSQKLEYLQKLEHLKSGVLEMQNLLQYHIFTYFDNKCSKVPRAISKKGVNLKSLLEKIESKQGLFRSNLSGKRTDFIMRAVIVGDAQLKLNEVGISKTMAKSLTKPVGLTENNLEEAKEWVQGLNNVEATYYEFFNEDEDETPVKLKITDLNRQFVIENLKVGGTLHRTLMTGDRVVFNRQPTLHRYGMMSHKLVVHEDLKLEGMTIKINPAVCLPYGADFDGDEGVILIAKSTSAETEMELLMDVLVNITDTKKGNSIIAVSKENLSAAYGLSLTEDLISKNTVIDLFGEDYGYLDIDFKKNLFTGKQILSLLLPKGFSYEDKSGIVIKQGQFLNGVLTKRNFSNASSLMTSLASFLGSEYGKYLTRMIQVFNKYYKYMKQSISYDSYSVFEYEKKDLKLDQFKLQEKQLYSLNKIAKTLKKIPTEEKLKNPVITMTDCNSSGSTVGVSQIVGVVGTKKIRGSEIGSFFKNCYPNYQLSQQENNTVIKGFITQNYAQGLSFEEYITDSVQARDNNLDNQLNVSALGYFNRRITNAFADLIVNREGFIEDGSKKIIQYEFGNNNVDLINYKPKVISEPLQEKLNEWSLVETEDPKVITLDNVEKVLDNTLGPESTKKKIILSNFKKDHSLSIPQFLNLIEYISNPVGYPLGLTTAHALAEPTTQMTLSAKHDFSGFQSKFNRLLELTEKVLTRPKIKITYKEDLYPKIKQKIQKKKISELFAIYLNPKKPQIIMAGDLTNLTKSLLKTIKQILPNYQVNEVKDSTLDKKNITSVVFIPKEEISSAENYKNYLHLSNTLVGIQKAEVHRISATECYLIGYKGSCAVYGLAETLKTLYPEIELELTDPVYVAKVYGVEAARKILYQEFEKFTEEGLDVDPRYFSLFCDLVTNEGELLGLGRTGVASKKPPLASLSYEAAKTGIYKLAMSREKDYLRNPYSCLMTNKKIKVGADYFEVQL